mgnify:CR=1 FL=1
MADDLPPDFEDNPDWTTVPVAPLDTPAKLKDARAHLGLTQAMAADLLGVPLATLRNWEQRRTTPDDAAETLIRLRHEHPREIHAMLTARAVQRMLICKNKPEFSHFQ